MPAWPDDVVLRAWEAGSARQGVYRAVAMLAAFHPECSESDIARLPLGRRNRMLADAYRSGFGPALRGEMTCAACSERLEFAVPAESLLVGDVGDSGTEFAASGQGLELTLRLPDSADLAAAAGAPSVEAARAVLINRCVLSARRSGEAVEPAALSDEEVAFAGDEIAGRDPLTDTTLQLRCAACGHVSESGLDLAAFLWAELAAYARRLLYEVHQLARAYGWSEREILGLGAVRRRYYLELVYS